MSAGKRWGVTLPASIVAGAHYYHFSPYKRSVSSLLPHIGGLDIVLLGFLLAFTFRGFHKGEMRFLVTLQFLLHVVQPLRVTPEQPGLVMEEAVRAVLGRPDNVQCSLLLLTHGPISRSAHEIFIHIGIPVGMFEVHVVSRDGDESLPTQLSQLVEHARQIRRKSWCVTVVVVTNDPGFLATFAEMSLEHRLLVWFTRLLVLTRLTLQQIHRLLSSHWTFSMMNSMVLNQQQESSGSRFSLYSHLPYSPQGSQVVRVASWLEPAYRSLIIASSTIFPEKFSNFHGATVNVTVLPYAPYWEETVKEAEDGRSVKTYSGTDYQLLLAMSTTLNFTINVLPASTWEEVGQLVALRLSFMSPMHHVPVDQRLAIYDFSYGYEYGSFAFCAAMPSLTPQWQSLYYPFSDFVWLAVLAVLLFVPVSFYVVNLLGTWLVFEDQISFGAAIQMVIATVFAQNLPTKLPESHASRALVVAWLLFAFIVGTVYRSNLTASLTLPKYPSRPETVEDMVKAFDRISMPSYGQVFIDNFKNSSYSVFQEMGEKMFIISNALEAMQRSRENRESHVGWKSYMATVIARHFIKADGSAQIYLGRESVSRTLTAWPLPHDAPFKRQVDAIMVAVLEAGLYEKWRSDFLDAVKKETREQQKKTLQEEEEEGLGNAGGLVSALNLVHMQGPMLLLLLGLALAGVVFTLEIVAFYSPLCTYHI